MKKFAIIDRVKKEEIFTEYGTIGITQVELNPLKLEDNLVDIIFNDDNLSHMFQMPSLSLIAKNRIFKRFIPKDHYDDIEDFVNKAISKHKSFYSFLAEGVLSLVYRDLYDFSLSVGAIDLNESLTDSHTGRDACMYNLERNIIILGEAKFYENFLF